MFRVDPEILARTSSATIRSIVDRAIARAISLRHPKLFHDRVHQIDLVRRHTRGKIEWSNLLNLHRRQNPAGTHEDGIVPALDVPETGRQLPLAPAGTLEVSAVQAVSTFAEKTQKGT